MQDLRQTLMRISTTQKYDWRDKSLCKDLDTDLFFPDTRRVNIEKYIQENLPCGNCKVKKECNDFADENEEEFGVWGGVYRSPYIMKLGNG